MTKFHMLAGLVAALALAGPLSAAESDTHKFLAERHADRGVACTSCHPKEPSKEVDMKSCLLCHGGNYEALAKRTESDDINIHATHLGEAQCVTCHSGHKQPQLSCDACHEFDDIRVP